MDSTDASTTVAWALTADPAEGVPALESLAREYAWLNEVPLDDLLTHGGSHQGELTGARELMSSLLSVAMPCSSPAQLSLYVILTARVYMALFLDTVERKRRLQHSEKSDTSACVHEDSLLARVHVTMQAWTRDLVPALVRSVLPQLHLRDAEPTTVRVSSPIDCTAKVPALGFAAEAKSTFTEQQRDLLKALNTYRVREELVRLVIALYRTTGDHDDAAAALLLAVYATLCNTESCPSADLPQTPLPGLTTTTLQQWRTRFSQEMTRTTRWNVETDCAPASETTAVDDLSSSFNQCFERLREVAGEVPCYHSRDALSFALGALQAFTRSPSHDGTLHSTDVERGTAPPDCTETSLAMEHDREVEASTLVPLDSLDALSGVAATGSPEDSFCLPLCRQGALLLLADVLRHRPTLGAQPSFAYSVSACSLFLGVADAYAVSLRCVRSAAALLRQLLFLTIFSPLCPSTRSAVPRRLRTPRHGCVAKRSSARATRGATRFSLT
ncbi:hypothetical protein, conserved [Leishmania tarentolae]|uniref:Uncharacterized protein n=1 Tax=Leishmania tarentolae TaxID=5689 RepID=A0A640KJB1_LEITA|nr:hypothetical protein, conserved [Leishmania tarentolae]